MKVRLIPVSSIKRYECFECGQEYEAVRRMVQCTWCHEEDNFHLMH